jgi:hypothetical protein
MSDNSRLPPNNLDSEYPYNRTWTFEDGTSFTVDSSKGSTAIRIHHGKSSSYMHVDDTGKATMFTTGDAHFYHKSGMTMSVDHNSDVKLSGAQRISVDGGSHIEVRGDAAVTVGGDSTSVVAGNMQASVAGSGYMSTAGPMSMNFAGDLKLDVGGTTTIKSGGDIKMNAPNIRLNS